MVECKIGIKCGNACINKNKECRVGALSKTSKDTASALTDRIASSNLSFDKVLAEGAYGIVELDTKNNVVRKTLKDREDGQNAFGPHELELGVKMGEAGLGPKVYKSASNDRQIVMDVVKGNTLWKSFRQDKETEPTSMSEAAGRNSLRAIDYMHRKLGFSHNDNHVLQHLIDDNDNVSLIDYGLSKPIAEDPKAALTDLSKMYKFAGLERYREDPEFGNSVKIVEKYREIKGKSKAAEAARTEVIAEYLKEINK